MPRKGKGCETTIDRRKNLKKVKPSEAFLGLPAKELPKGIQDIINRGSLASSAWSCSTATVWPSVGCRLGPTLVSSCLLLSRNKVDELEPASSPPEAGPADEEARPFCLPEETGLEAGMPPSFLS